MSVPQYLRKATLIIGDDEEALDLSEMRFRFTIRRGDYQTPNTCDIRIYNLSQTTAQKIKKEFTRVLLQAGYDGNFGTIFDGTIKQIRRGRENPTDTYIDVTAADGDNAYNYSVTSISLAAGQTAPANAIETIIRGMATHGVSKGYVPDNLPGAPLPRGEVHYGMSRDILRKLASSSDAAWSIQDGKVDVIPLTSYKPSSEIPVITAATGMIGLPEQTQNGIRVRVLLNPKMKIGQLIKIDNKSILQLRYSMNNAVEAQQLTEAMGHKLDDDGFYYVMIADHTGDTRGNAWYTDMICLAVDATMTPGVSGTMRYPLAENVIKRNP